MHSTKQGCEVKRFSDFCMGTAVSLALRGAHEDDGPARDAWSQVMAWLRDVDAAFSPYRSDSLVMRVNAGELRLEDCPPEMHEVWQIGVRAKRDSGGLFDMYYGGSFDPSGVVKGWALDRATKSLRHLDDTDFCLSAGGDMVCFVADDRRPAWRVGIEDPDDVARVAGTVEIRDGAVATSSMAWRPGHLVDPRTGEASTQIGSVTIVAPDLVTADIASTVAFIEGRRTPRASA